MNYNKYMRKMDAEAKKHFEAYKSAEDNYEAAKKTAKQYPKIYPERDPKYTANRILAETSLEEAKQAFYKAQRNFTDSVTKFNSIRAELADEVEFAYAADPSKVDRETMELMRSGILTASEYTRLMNNAADNPTMQRLIAKAAADRAENTKDDKEADALRRLSFTIDDGSEHLKTFDTLVDVYKRCTKNPVLISKWDELCGDTVQNYGKESECTTESVRNAEHI